MTRNKPTTTELYEKLIQKFVEWAKARPDIRTAIVIGSRARVDHPADEWADLDMIVATTNPQHYIATSEWTSEMGKPMLTFIEETSGGDEKERRVLYEGMLDVDYAIFPAAKVELLQMVEGPEQLPAEMALQLANTFGRGMRVIVDKDGVTEKLKALISKIGQSAPSLPTQDEFLQVVNDFLYHSVWTAKHVLRGELWWGLTCLNCLLARLLEQMIEWQARAKHGNSYDTWFRGRFLEMWADPEALKGLKNSFAHYKKQDAAVALKATMDLFRKTATDTANKLSFKYPTDADRKIAEWIETYLPSDPEAGHSNRGLPEP